MTEEDWQTCTDPARMLDALNSYHPLGPFFGGLNLRASWVDPRKARLLGTACCRSFLPLSSDERARRAVEVAELYVERLASTRELAAAAEAAQAAGSWAGRLAATACAADPKLASVFIVQEILEQQPRAGPQLASLIRDLFNPFRHARIPPAYRTPEVLELADTIYREPAYERLPVLANALETAGYSDTSILAHCRGPGPHTRGCWAVDAILGKP